MYMATMYNRVVALDADTGKEIWVKDVGHTPSTRGIAYWPGTNGIPPQLVFGTGDGSSLLISLNAKTGEFTPGFGQGGKVDLRQGVGEKFPRLRVALSSPPAIYKTSRDHRQSLAGKLQASDPRATCAHGICGRASSSGRFTRFRGRASRTTTRGKTISGSIARERTPGDSLPSMKRAASRTCPTGTPATDFYGGDRLGSNLYGSSLVALDAATGKLKWFFQTTHHDNWDYDLNSPPTLIDVKRNGRTIPAVAVYTKQGLLFVFDRVTGTPVFGVEERPVVSDNPLPGDEYSPTQPFPVKPPPIARMTFSPEEIAKVTPEHESVLQGSARAGRRRDDGRPVRAVWTEAPRDLPGWTGGGNWNGSAFNPDLGYLFVPTQDHGMLNKMVKSTLFENMYVRSGPDNAPPMLGTNFWDGRKGWPCQQPPWGELVAVNANTGDIAWRVPLGSFEELDALGVPATGTLNRGGPIATAGGLVFIAASQDARFRAFDARTGKVLWVADLTENGRAVPITYQGKRGTQYVAIMAGGGRPVARKVDESRIGGRLHVFALAAAQIKGSGRLPDAFSPHAVDRRRRRTMCG